MTPTPPIPYLGEILSLATALLWAVAVILFKRSGEQIAPVALNTAKTGFAFLLMIPTLLIAGVPFFPADAERDLVIALASGAIGIGVADVMFFRSLNLLGAARTAVVETLYSPSVILFAYLWLGERLTLPQGAGALLIVLAVFVTSYEGRLAKLEQRQLALGLMWGVMAHALMAIGLVMVKPVLAERPLLWVIEARFAGGLVALALLLAFTPGRFGLLRELARRGRRGYTLAGSFVGAYLVLMTWLGGMKYAPASVAAALNQTSTILTFLLAALVLGEAMNRRRVVAVLLAMAGALLVTFG